MKDIKITEDQELELLCQEEDIKSSIERAIDKVNESIVLKEQIQKLISLNNQLESIRKMILCDHEFKYSGFSTMKHGDIVSILLL